jgi:hypothetical protein
MVCVEIRLALPVQFSLLAEFFIGKVLVKERDSRVLTLVNLNPGFQTPFEIQTKKSNRQK